MYSGILSNQDAQAFARAFGFGHLSDHSLFRDSPCDDGGAPVLWTREGRISCTCSCGDNQDAPAGWRAAFNAVFEAQESLFASGQIVTGPAQLALLAIGMGEGPPPAIEARSWPLERAPEASEIVTGQIIAGLPALDESSGALITDPAELVYLRGLRLDYSARVEHPASTPVLWTNPDTDVVQLFYMLLRDEVPATVRQALETAQAP